MYSSAVQNRLADWRESLGELLNILKGDTSNQTLEQLRKQYDDMLAAHPVPGGVQVDEVYLGSIPTLRVAPQGRQPTTHLLYFHGGAYLFGSPRGYLGLASRLAIANDAVVLVPDFRLAPEHPYPTPILDCVDAYRALLDSGVAASSVLFAGDSAGGALTVSVMVHARNRGWPLPAGGTAISPWCDLTHAGRTMRTREGIDPLCTREALDLQARSFLQGARPESPDASPIYADLRGLPPVLIQVGEAEVMMSGAIALAEQMADSQVRTSLEVWPNMFHVWPLFAAILPDAEDAIASSAAFHSRCLRAAKRNDGGEEETRVSLDDRSGSRAVGSKQTV